jgi:hypothetical protein
MRDGAGGPETITRTSKYGSVTTCGWDIAWIDGPNERSLAPNMLYLADSDYGRPAAGDPRKPMSRIGAIGPGMIGVMEPVRRGETGLPEGVKDACRRPASEVGAHCER